MPRWIYHRPPDKCHETELRLAQILNDRLPDNWIVRWGYWYEDDNGTLREGDFLVLGPTGGLAVFEVKTSVSHVAATGKWNTSDGDSPLSQLMAQHAGVIQRLQEAASGRKTPRVSKALVFPILEIAPKIPEYRGIPRNHIVALNDLQAFDATWRHLLKGSWTVTEEQRSVFLDAYGEGIDPKSIKAFVTETDKVILRQATANYRMLDMLSENQQLLVEGGVGTGKSWYAIEQARRLAENPDGGAGRHVLMVAYNLALCERLRVTVGKPKCRRGSVTVQSAESIAAAILNACGISHEVPGANDQRQRYFDEVLPGLALEALATESANLASLTGQYDALVVDEAQDHDTSLSGFETQEHHAGWWSIYVALVKGGWSAPISIFGDPAQRPPFRATARYDSHVLRQKLQQHAHLRLDRSMRYTRPIYLFLRKLRGDGTHELVEGLRSDGSLPDGPEVIQLETPLEQVPASVDAILSEWSNSGLCSPPKVLILYDRSSIDRTALAACQELAGHALAPFVDTVDETARRTIGHTSIHKAKGLDSLAVILVGLRPFDQLDLAYDRYTYFMGASRARQLLACVHVKPHESAPEPA